jgi:hypothetical protein
MSSRATLIRDPKNLRDRIGFGGHANAIFGRSLVVHPPARAGAAALLESVLVAFGKRRSMGDWPRRGTHLESAVSLWLHAHPGIDWIVVRSAQQLQPAAIDAVSGLAERLNRRLALVDSGQPGAGRTELGDGRLELEVDKGRVASCIHQTNPDRSHIGLEVRSDGELPELSDSPAPNFLAGNLVDLPDELKFRVVSAFNLGRAVMRQANSLGASTLLGRARYLLFTAGSRWEAVSRVRGAQLELLANRVWLSMPDVHSSAWMFRPSLDREAVDRLLGYVDPTRALLGALSALCGLDAQDLCPADVVPERGGHVVSLLGQLRLRIPDEFNAVVRACEEQSLEEREHWAERHAHAAAVGEQLMRIQGEVARCLTHTSWTRQAGFSITRFPRSP